MAFPLASRLSHLSHLSDTRTRVRLRFSPSQLMKRLRGAKAATVGTKDEKKKVMGALDSDIHKLLGTEYKRYRTVQVYELWPSLSLRHGLCDTTPHWC